MRIFSKFFGGGGAERREKPPEVTEKAIEPVKAGRKHEYTPAQVKAIKDAVSEAYSDTATARDTGGSVNAKAIEGAAELDRVPGSDFSSPGEQALVYGTIDGAGEVTEGVETTIRPLGEDEEEDTSDPAAVAGRLEDLLTTATNTEQPAPATIRKVEGGSGDKEIVTETEAPGDTTRQGAEQLTEAKLQSWVAKVEAGMSLEVALEVLAGSIEEAKYAVEDAQEDGTSAIVKEKMTELNSLMYVQRNLAAAVRDKAA
ncbi:MAG: hypothetical protein O3B64_00645 [bacterium]|nr:hypothetical protein [bacterium]MDA1024701.1 hypothetical protein [bacterium]